MHKRLPVWLMAAVTGSGLAALAVPAIGAIPQASGDACKLLSAAQVTKVLGVSVDEGAYSIPDHTQFCVWRESGKAQMAAQNVQVNLLTANQFDAPKTGPYVQGGESGLGDEAYWAKIPGNGLARSLSVRKGDKYFRVSARPIPEGMTRKSDSPDDQAKWDEKTKTVEKAIAVEVLQKI